MGGELTGYVHAGESDVPVQYIRICADFGTDNSKFGNNTRKKHNLAQHMPVKHSKKGSTASEKVYVVADGNEFSASSKVAKDEYLRIDVSHWSSIEDIQVCMKKIQTSLEPTYDRKSQIVDVFVQDFDPADTGNHGHQCKYDPDEVLQLKGVDGQLIQCLQFFCVGTSLKSFHGQFVTAVAKTKLEVTEISARGTRTRFCTYSDITNKEGLYELQIQDSSDNAIPMKTIMHVGAYKEEVFPETIPESFGHEQG